MSGFGLGFGFAYVRSILSRVAATEIFTANVANLSGAEGLALNPALVPTLTDWSVNMRFNTDSFAGAPFLFAPYVNYAGVELPTGVVYMQTDGTLIIQTKNIDVYTFSQVGSTVLNLSQDYDLYITHDASAKTFEVYLDGVFEMSLAYTGTLVASTSLTVGGRIVFSAFSNGLDGRVWDIEMFNKLLSVDELAEVVNVDKAKCFALYDQTIKDACVTSIPAYNHTGFTGEERTDQSASGNNASDVGGTVVFTGTAQILCEEYVPSVNDMLMTIDTTQAGSASDTFIFPLTSMGGLASIQIEWGDGSSSVITSVGQAELTHVYAVGGTYDITIIGDLGYLWKFANLGDKNKLKAITQWGNTTVENDMLWGCALLDDLSASDAPYFDGTNLFRPFQGCNALLTIANFSQWDFGTTAIINQFFNSSDLLNMDVSQNDYSLITSLPDFMALTSFSTANYDLLIESWHDGVSVTGKQPVTGCPVGVGTTQYSSAVQAKYDALVTYGIVFTDGGVV